MKSSIALLALAASSVTAFAPQQSMKKSVTEVELTREEILSEPNNIEFGKMWDPLGLAELGGDETIAWFRHAEVKHGRVAMAAFVGWTVVAGAGWRFPGELAHGTEFASLPSKGLEAWDAVPGWGKAQMLLLAGLIEFHDELFFAKRGTHYMKGGVPGKVSKDISPRKITISDNAVMVPNHFLFVDVSVEHGSWTLRSFQLVR